MPHASWARRSPLVRFQMPLLLALFSRLLVPLAPLFMAVMLARAARESRDEVLRGALLELQRLRVLVERRLVVVLVGPPSSGKDAAILALFGLDTGGIHPVAGSTSAVAVYEAPGDDHIQILNTPGLGDVLQALTRETREVLDQADLFLFLVNAQGGVRQRERDEHSRVRQRQRPTLVLLNKLDTLREADRERLRDVAEKLRVPRAEVVGVAVDPLPQLKETPLPRGRPPLALRAAARPGPGPRRAARPRLSRVPSASCGRPGSAGPQGVGPHIELAIVGGRCDLEHPRQQGVDVDILHRRQAEPGLEVRPTGDQQAVHVALSGVVAMGPAAHPAGVFLREGAAGEGEAQLGHAMDRRDALAGAEVEGFGQVLAAGAGRVGQALELGGSPSPDRRRPPAEVHPRAPGLHPDRVEVDVVVDVEESVRGDARHAVVADHHEVRLVEATPGLQARHEATQHRVHGLHGAGDPRILRSMGVARVVRLVEVERDEAGGVLGLVQPVQDPVHPLGEGHGAVVGHRPGLPDPVGPLHLGAQNIVAPHPLALRRSRWARRQTTARQRCRARTCRRTHGGRVRRVVVDDAVVARSPVAGVQWLGKVLGGRRAPARQPGRLGRQPVRGGVSARSRSPTGAIHGDQDDRDAVGCGVVGVGRRRGRRGSVRPCATPATGSASGAAAPQPPTGGGGRCGGAVGP